MTTLRVYDTPQTFTQTQDFAAIAQTLSDLGIRLERWTAQAPLTPTATPEEVLSAYQTSVDQLKALAGFKTADVIAVHPGTPNHADMRKKFLAEHIHSDDEVRFFVDGRGLFWINAGGRVYGLMCEKNDLLNVPAGTQHWFDMGAEPNFKCIRVFVSPEGWVAQSTGSGVNERYPTFEAFTG